MNTLDGATYPGESLFWLRPKRIWSAREVYQICFCEMRKLPTKNGINWALDTTQDACQTPAMKPVEVVRRYIDAWNSHDANTLVAAFTIDGTYCNPHTHPGLSGDALAEFLKGVYTAFPDFHVELLNAGEIEPELVAIHWLVTGTNTGERREGPATGRSVSIKGASIIQLEGDKIASDQCYFDRAAFDEQVEPKA